jgi:hypothetical protein
MPLSDLFDRLTSRVRAREQSAHERLAAAAKAQAKGQSVDVSGLEDALFSSRMDLDDFRKLCELEEQRSAAFVRLEKLGPARTRVEKLDAQIAAENAKHEEIVEAYRKRWVGLRDEAREAQTVVDNSRQARDWLLAVENCPPGLRREYREALDAQQAALVARDGLTRSIKEKREQIQSEEHWIKELEGEGARDLAAIGDVITKSGRERLNRATVEKIETHERRKQRAVAALEDLQKQSAAAEAAILKADAAVHTVQKKVLTP